MFIIIITSSICYNRIRKINLHIRIAILHGELGYQIQNRHVHEDINTRLKLQVRHQANAEHQEHHVRRVHVIKHLEHTVDVEAKSVAARPEQVLGPRGVRQIDGGVQWSAGQILRENAPLKMSGL